MVLKLDIGTVIILFQIKETKNLMKTFARSNSISKSQMDMNKMIISIVGVFVFCNSFQILNYFIKSNMIESIADFFLTFNSSINAIVYGIFSRKYQEVLLSMVACGMPQCNSMKQSETGKRLTVVVPPENSKMIAS